MSNLSNDERNKVNRFTSITNASEKRAINMLKTYSWNVDRAIDEFFNQTEKKSTSFNEYQQQRKKNLEKQKQLKNQKPKKTWVDRNKIEVLFNKYKDKETGLIEYEGVERFLTECGVDLMAVESLILSWHMNAQIMGAYTKKEFCDGLFKIKCENLEDLKERIPFLKDELEDKATFDDFNSFVFTFAKEDPNHRVLDNTIAVALWPLLYKDKFKLLDKWLEFWKLEENKKKTISQDLWDTLAEFSRTIKSVEDYDPMEAWPALLDEFMEWLEEQN
ncbi:rp42 related [Anaeramoeba flamelloides]|uniref:Defective in cullin neddylation protein n=1 Tax=Anaeramoeba flamelloides TaxID=1746091 RepID=A0AAV7ZD14_9EUKA|nr:rp42 related [Anaeramoeba flamelloides]KAJ6235314.1 rp42 related [Anaeramoeba flamelloides]